MSSILLGLVLTFGDPEARTLNLTVALTEPATVALAWGELVRGSSAAAELHRFRSLPVPVEAPLEYTITVAGQQAERATLRPFPKDGPLRIAVYGDTREGTAPHRLLVAAMAKSSPDLVIHTGDVVRMSTDRTGWREALQAFAPIGGRVPLVLALGNHDVSLSPQDRAAGVDPLAAAFEVAPPPEDPLARKNGASPASYHLRVGPVLIVVIDSSAPCGPDSGQRKFVEAALAEKGDARFVLIALHHGPVSAGPHGPHPELAWLPPLAAKAGVTAVLSGHDHVYQRAERDGVRYLISGGGGAPLYWRGHFARGILAFAAVYNWLSIDLAPDRAELSAWSLEGALLDRASLIGSDGASQQLRIGSLVLAGVGAAIASLALLAYALLLARG